MKRNLFLICGLFFCLSASSQVPFIPPAPSFEPLPKTLYENGDYDEPTSLVLGTVYEAVTHITVVYAHHDEHKNHPRLTLEVNKAVAGKIDVGSGDSLSITFHVNIPANPEGYAIMIYGEQIELGNHKLEPITILGIYINGDYSRTIDIYYFANPEFTGLRHEISALESETCDRWRAHRIFTPGAWEPFCLPLPADRVYTVENDGTISELLPSTYTHPDGHYWIRSFRDPCVEELVGTNWLIPDSLAVPEAGVGYILMLPDDLWWQGREICFEGRFLHGGGRMALSDDYSESFPRSVTLPSDFTYLANTTFVCQEVAEGWLPNVTETQGRYFDNHGTSYTLHPMECHLIGGSATTGIARIGTRDPSTFPLPTALDESLPPSSSTSSSSLSSTSASTSKILYNGHVVILRDGRLYDLLGHSQ